MNESQLKFTWLILKELRNQQQHNQVKLDTKRVNENIAAGIQQLDKGEGTDFNEFLNEVKLIYGKTLQN